MLQTPNLTFVTSITFKIKVTTQKRTGFLRGPWGSYTRFQFDSINTFWVIVQRWQWPQNWPCDPTIDPRDPKIYRHLAWQWTTVCSKFEVDSQSLENSVLSFGHFRVIFGQILQAAEFMTEFWQNYCDNPQILHFSAISAQKTHENDHFRIYSANSALLFFHCRCCIILRYFKFKFLHCLS